MTKTKVLILICACLLLPAAGCGQKAKPTAEKQDAATTTTIIQPKTDDKIAQDTALSNPATVYCLSEGGKFTMRKTLLGTTEGLCTLPDNITCEVWAYYQGDCPKGSKKQKTDVASSTSATTTSTRDTPVATSTSGGSLIHATGTKAEKP
jgi:putative hemolysin